MLYMMEYPCSLGILCLVCDETSLIGLWFHEEKRYLDRLIEKPVTNDRHPILVQARNWIDEYFMQKKPDPLSLPLRPIGNEFRQMVWHELLKIPYGTMTTYGTIAKMIESKTKTRMSSQAVGQAIGHNPIAIIIPCHRVISSTNNVTGYAYGIDRKLALLVLEGVDISVLKVPKQKKIHQIGV